ncbi:MAG: ABC transporter ATP-binding protein [Rhizobiaceae bacterium]|nr:ABC transporter ATP-binding protein [Rhizobiaceae bacterium]
MADAAPVDDLVVEDLHVRYGKVAAVNGVSLKVRRGAVVAVLGANGAGKSSTLNAIAGNLRASISGRVTLLGGAVAGLRAHAIVQKGMALVPEGREIIAPLTVEENLLLAGYGGRAGSEEPRLLADVYDMFPILSERRHTPGGMLSGGEQQMLAFGRIIMVNPQVVLMDEPSMGLSPRMVDFIMRSIRKISQRGLTILLVEQNANAALQIADYVYVLDRGRVVQEGAAADLRSDTGIAETFLGLKSHAPA